MREVCVKKVYDTNPKMSFLTEPPLTPMKKVTKSKVANHSHFFAFFIIHNIFDFQKIKF